MVSLGSSAADQFVPALAGGAPGALGKEDKDIPTLTAYMPDPAKATGAAIVICPGGGYGGLAPHEGGQYARFLNEYGIAGFVLKYRLGPDGYRHPAMLHDAARAVRTVRANAGEWKLDPKRIGIMGSSAGGHLASTLLTHFDAGKPDAADPIERQSSRPDLGILCYAVISMGELGHRGSRNNLLGKDPSPELVRELSNELHVTKDTPPCFIWHTSRTTECRWRIAFSLPRRCSGPGCHLICTSIKKASTALAWARAMEPREAASLDARLHLLVAGAGVCGSRAGAVVTRGCQ